MTGAARPVVVTGAAGFVGSHVVDAFLAAGSAVTAVVRPTSDRRWLDAARVRVAFAEVGDEAAMAAAADGAGTFVHVAGITQARRLEDFERVNAAGAGHAARAAARSGVSRFILVSSQAAGGPTPGEAPRTEDDPDAPTSAYGRSKLEGERRVRAALADSGIALSIVRPPAVYGPRDVAFLELFRFVAAGIVPLHRADRQWVSLVHVRDLASGVVRMAAGGVPGATYYLTDGAPVTSATLVDTIARALHKKPLKLDLPLFALEAAVGVAETWSRWTGAPARLTRERLIEWTAPRWTVCDARARRDLGYESTIALQQGIAETAAWYRSQRWI